MAVVLVATAACVVGPSYPSAPLPDVQAPRITGALHTEGTRIVGSDGRTIPTRTTVWATGIEPPPLVKDLDVPKDPRGRILVDEFLRVEAQGRLAAAKSAPPPYPNLSDKVTALESTLAVVQGQLAEAQAAPEYTKLRKQRYASFDSGKGRAFEQGKVTLEELSGLAHKNGEPEQLSGRQEYYENIISRFV